MWESLQSKASELEALGGWPREGWARSCHGENFGQHLHLASPINKAKGGTGLGAGERRGGSREVLGFLARETTGRHPWLFMARLPAAFRHLGPSVTTLGLSGSPVPERPCLLLLLGSALEMPRGLGAGLPSDPPGPLPALNSPILRRLFPGL